MLAGLGLSSDEYTEHMIFKDGRPSEFYQSYVRDIQRIITENAANEFGCIWREHARLQGAKPRTIISDELSSKLNELQEELEDSDLFDDEPSRRGVMQRAIPKTLVDKVGLDALLQRLPVPYQRALFSSYVAAHFVRRSISSPPFSAWFVWCGLLTFILLLVQIYKYGVNASSVDFFHFARDLASAN